MHAISRMAAVLAAALISTASAMDGPIRVEGAWSRAMPAVAKNGAAYMVVHNTGATDDRIVAARSSVAGRTELHNHVMKGGVMKMSKVPGIAIPAGGMATLAPGGLHVMMMGLTEPLDAGKTIIVTLEFEKAKPLAVDVPVHEGAMAPAKHSHD